MSRGIRERISGRMIFSLYRYQVKMVPAFPSRRESSTSKTAAVRPNGIMATMPGARSARAWSIARPSGARANPPGLALLGLRVGRGGRLGGGLLRLGGRSGLRRGCGLGGGLHRRGGLLRWGRVARRLARLLLALSGLLELLRQRGERVVRQRLALGGAVRAGVAGQPRAGVAALAVAGAAEAAVVARAAAVGAIGPLRPLRSLGARRALRALLGAGLRRRELGAGGLGRPGLARR